MTVRGGQKKRRFGLRDAPAEDGRWERWEPEERGPAAGTGVAGAGGGAVVAGDSAGVHSPHLTPLRPPPPRTPAPKTMFQEKRINQALEN